ncbi:MAG: hypothetical protein HY316_02685 [Acidobacteria bacterium]|nr:hypothetical protein [Acidobacteriota bacterium]
MEHLIEPRTSELTAVLSRLKKLGTQNRRFKQIGAVALILLGSVFLMGQASPPRTVEANEFVLKDANGRIRGKWSMNGDSVLFTLLDSKGVIRVLLAQDGLLDQAALHLRAANGNQRVTFEVDSKGSPALFLQSPDSNLVYLGQEESGTATLRLFGTDGKVLWKAP